MESGANRLKITSSEIVEDEKVLNNKQKRHSSELCHGSLVPQPLKLMSGLVSTNEADIVQRTQLGMSIGLDGSGFDSFPWMTVEACTAFG